MTSHQNELTIASLMNRLNEEVAKDPKVSTYTILCDGIGSSKFQIHHRSKVVRLGRIEPETPVVSKKPRLESHRSPEGGDPFNVIRGRMRL